MKRPPGPADPFRTMNGGLARTPNTDTPHLSFLEARPTTLHSMEAARAGRLSPSALWPAFGAELSTEGICAPGNGFMARIHHSI